MQNLTKINAASMHAPRFGNWYPI